MQSPKQGSTAHCKPQHNIAQQGIAEHRTAVSSRPHRTTAQHSTAQHSKAQHTSPHHTTPHHTLSTRQLYSRAGCRVRSPRRQGPGTANRRCTNSVGCAHVPVPSTIPRDPAAPSTSRLGPGNGQRPSVEDGSPSLPLLSSPTRPPTHQPTQEPGHAPLPRLCPTHRALCPNSIPHTPMQLSVPPMHYLP